MNADRKYFIKRNRDISAPFEYALSRRGWNVSENIDEAQFLFLDYEARAYEDLIYRAEEREIPIFIYPHSTICEVLWDGPYVPGKVACNFVAAPWQKRVMREYSYPNRIEVIGWPWTPIFPNKPLSERPKTILFAPRHPNPATGHMHPVYRKENALAMKILKEQTHYSNLIVRYCGDLNKNYLGDISGKKIRFNKVIKMGTGSSVVAIMEDVDLVVSWGTFAYLSVALGKPTIMYGQDYACTNGKECENWKKYKEFRRYPIDLSDKNVIDCMIHGDYNIERWKSKFIGNLFDGDYFVDIIEEVVSKYRT